MQHLGHLSLMLRGRCSTPEMSAEVRRALSAMGACCFCVAGVALGAPQSHLAWQVQHLEHQSHLVIRRPLHSGPAAFAWQVLSFCVARQVLGASQPICGTWKTLVSFCATGAALSISVSFCVAGGCSTRSTSREVCASPERIGYYGRPLQVQHLEHLSLI